MVEYIIRMAMPEDKVEIEKIIRDFVEERNKGKFDDKRFEWGILRRIYDPLQRHGIFIAINEEDENIGIIGILFGELRVDPFGESECYIKQIFVEPKYRGNLVGKKLLQKTIEHLKNIKIDKIKVNLHLDSVKTKALFAEYNFEPKYTVLELDLDKEKKD